MKFVSGYAHINPPRSLLPQWRASWPEENWNSFEKVSETQRDEFWARLGKLSTSLSPKEREYSLASAVTLTEQQQIDGSWRIESLQVLGWSLGNLDCLPAYDTQCSVEFLKRYPAGRHQDFISAARLRPDPEISQAREIAELWHWRSRTRQLQEQGVPLPDLCDESGERLQSLDDVVREAAKFAAERGDLPRLIEGDFPVFGKAYRDISDEEWSIVQSITMERHFTLNWLCGYSPDMMWDDTPTDT